jgi:hypothetical protein
MASITVTRALKHVALFLVCAAVALLLGYWGAVLSLAAK